MRSRRVARGWYFCCRVILLLFIWFMLNLYAGLYLRAFFLSSLFAICSFAKHLGKSVTWLVSAQWKKDIISAMRLGCCSLRKRCRWIPQTEAAFFLGWVCVTAAWLAGQNWQDLEHTALFKWCFLEKSFSFPSAGNWNQKYCIHTNGIWYFQIYRGSTMNAAWV